LAASLALNARAADVLISDVLWRLPIPVRLGMLADLMQRKELLDRWPFVIPVLRRFFELRHELAHGLAAPEVSGQTILVATVKRGRGSGRIYRTEQLEWLAWQAHAARIELAHIWAAVASSTKAWYEAGG